MPERPFPARTHRPTPVNSQTLCLPEPIGLTQVPRGSATTLAPPPYPDLYFACMTGTRQNFAVADSRAQFSGSALKRSSDRSRRAFAQFLDLTSRTPCRSALTARQQVSERGLW